MLIVAGRCDPGPGRMEPRAESASEPLNWRSASRWDSGSNSETVARRQRWAVEMERSGGVAKSQTAGQMQGPSRAAQAATQRCGYWDWVWAASKHGTRRRTGATSWLGSGEWSLASGCTEQTDVRVSQGVSCQQNTPVQRTAARRWLSWATNEREESRAEQSRASRCRTSCQQQEIHSCCPGGSAAACLSAQARTLDAREAGSP